MSKTTKHKASTLVAGCFKPFVIRFWFNNWPEITIITFLVLFFGKITLNGIEYSEYKEKFTVECERKGGVVFIHRGVKGWPIPECRSHESMIDVDV